jgi:hypothetical protein
MQSEKDVSNASDQKRSRCCWYPGRNNEFRAARLERVLIGDVKRQFARDWPFMIVHALLIVAVCYAFMSPRPTASSPTGGPQSRMAVEATKNAGVPSLPARREAR